MKKKILIAFFVIVIIIGIITNYVDSGRVTTEHEPKYCIKIVNSTGNKVTYWGLGYKVVRYVDVSPEESYQNNIGVKMGSWFMKYELPIDSENRKQEVKEIQSLNDFYQMKLTQDKDIRNLGKNYSSFDAQKDNCFVIGAMVHNDNLYHEFMQNYKNQKTAFIRVAQNTAEGDLILQDILYDERVNQLYLVIDNTRDEFSAEENRKIELKQFENIAEYSSENHLYWVMYNGEITDETLNSEQAFIVATIQ